jgi:predicted glycoside hydrolase/deacetylase ChbG (UPF0249 family)
MPPALVERLGFAAEARVALLHIDDIGVCHAANQGAFEALEAGPATCGSLMVPCPWFAEAAQWARRRPDLDLGVHLTLNDEWEGYRYGPVAGAGAVPSLVDGRGHFFPTQAETLARVRADEAELELRAQIDRALEAGIDVTHLDVHMGTALCPPIGEIYVRLACEYRLPAFLVRLHSEPWPNDPVGHRLVSLAAEGFPLLDAADPDSLTFAPGRGLEHNRERLRRLGPGVTWVINHAARGGPELDALMADVAHCRDFERGFYGGEAGRRVLAEEGIETVGTRPLRDLLRRDWNAAAD